MAKDYTAQIAAMQAKKEKLAARLGQLQGKAKLAERKKDTRRKIVVGAAVIAHMEHDPSFARLVASVLVRNVTRPADLEAIGELLPRPQPPPQAAPSIAMSSTWPPADGGSAQNE